jgi:hypothetical protein
LLESIIGGALEYQLGSVFEPSGGNRTSWGVEEWYIWLDIEHGRSVEEIEACDNDAVRFDCYECAERQRDRVGPVR